MSDAGKYLYCIIRGGESRVFPDIAPVSAATGTVYTLPGNGLAAVVSDAPARDLDPTRANMLAHERVQERVMKEYPLLPVRFGTVASEPNSVQRVERLLMKRSREFDELLAGVEEAVELGLKVLWRNEATVFDEILAEHSGIRKRRKSLEGTSPEATRLERIRLGELVKHALEQKRQQEAAGLLAPLRRIAIRTVENPVLLDLMIVNAAFLVSKHREESFDQAVNALGEATAARAEFKYVGPSPPYNFVNVVVNWEDI